MVEHLPVSINTKSIQYLFIKAIQKYAKKMSNWHSRPGKSKKILENYEIDRCVNYRFYDNRVSHEHLFAKDQT